MDIDPSNAVIIIPSRFASQRLPQKPLVPIAGIPLIQRVYERCSGTRNVRAVVVATDHPEIEALVRSFGGEVVMTSEHCPSGTDRVAEAAAALGLAEDDIVINVQGDEPLITADVIEATIGVLRANPKAPVSTAVSQLSNVDDLTSPNVVKAVLATDGSALYFSRSPIPYLRDAGMNTTSWLEHSTFYKHIGIYGYRLSALTRFVQMPEGILERAERLEQLRFLEAGIPILTALVQYDSVAVDTAEDVRAVELILAERSLQ